MSEPKIPEILTKKSQRELQPEELEARILKVLASRSLCVLSTCRDNVPRATPILFQTRGLTLYMAGEPGVKLGNIKLNPRVSVGIFDPKSESTHSWLDVEGLQISGHARLIGQDDPLFFETLKLFGHPKEWVTHWAGMFIEVVPDRIELLCMALKQDDYAARQVWIKPDS